MDNIPHGYCQCGCGRKTSIATETRRAIGHVKGQPLKFVLGHNGKRKPIEHVVEDRGFTTPCWIWQRHISDYGYGITKRDGKTMPAHKAYYEAKHGPVPEGLQLDHLCRVRECCNPDHVEPVSSLENSHRGAKTVLTQEQVDEMRAVYRAGGISTTGLARMFGISRTHAWAIVAGARWPN